MALSQIPEAVEGDTKTFTASQMAEAIGERDNYRQALYDATNARLVGADKAIEAYGVVDQLHRELHTVCKERDKAVLELGDADEILDSPVRTIRFALEVLTQVGRERAKARASKRHATLARSYSRREPRRVRRGRGF